jgi:hypothetical protein
LEREVYGEELGLDGAELRTLHGAEYDESRKGLFGGNC